MKFAQFIIYLLCISFSLSGQNISVGDTGDYPTLAQAGPNLSPGDTVFLQSQIYDDGAQFLTEVNGTSLQPIVIIAEQEHQAIFQGGTESIHLVKCNYLEINGIQVVGQSGNGMNIDDGGEYTVPSTHITIRNCILRDMQASGNNDLLKMSGIDHFLIENCQFINGGSGGSGVDFVGCHQGVVQDCLFDNAGTTGIQNKGGTQFIRIQRNVFKNIAQRALNLGGSTGLEFFRPPLPDPIVDAFEAADLEVFSNVFIGCWAPIAYVGSVRVKVYNNTFYQPDNWVIRILQETTVPGFLSCGENEFRNNIVYLANDLTEVNIGNNTDPGSFIFSNNLWYNANDNSWSPNLPVVDTDQLITDPMLVDPNLEDFHLSSNSPAIESGFLFSEPTTDFNENYYYVPPSIGAFEGHESTSQAHILVEPDNLVIYPNPSANSVLIEGDFSDANIYIIDEIGNVVQDYSNATNSILISLDQLPAGIYFVKVLSSTTEKLSLQKLIKY